ncbi:MAG TPA: DUF3263 domain-containing protein [Nocardioides sp.]|uniref:DUF3263 domain-containing protein n=1 Tax=Nocardioides sp. TaxID=35761 RepID=UPI002BE4460E|nr:DUF3263 domain-containing protein [Nocardioides sp.]HTW17046.1 DUF3263 domain-containing protein [Nocardioides sp.]
MTEHPDQLDARLSVRQAEVIAFERAGWFKFAGIRDALVLERFGRGPTRHAQVLHHVLSLPAADAYDPATVRRLVERRDLLRAHRSTKGLLP